MKKIISRIFCICLAICCVLSLSACEKKISRVSVKTTDVVSNGGPVAKCGNTIYFVNGFLKASATSNVEGKVGVSSLYKLVLNDDGTIEKNEEGAIQNLTQLVSSQTGFAKGSVYVFGDYVYYATPYTGKDKTGTVLYEYLSFYRVKNDGSDKTLLATTDTDDDTITYSYYVTGEDELCLVVFEKDSGYLTSYKITNKVEQIALDEDVVSCVFGENNGEGNTINSFVVYTKSVENSDTEQQGNKVIKVKANGQDKTVIGSAESFELKTICNGFLVYAVGTQTRISNLENKLAKTDKVISYITYATAYYFAGNNTVNMIVKDTTDSTNTKMKFVDGNNVANNYVLATEAVTVIGVSGNYVYYYNSSNVINKIKYTEAASSASNTAIKVSSKNISAQSGTMNPEIVGDYMYYFATLSNDEDDTSNEMLYRVKITETETQTAELVGKI